MSYRSELGTSDVAFILTQGHVQFVEVSQKCFGVPDPEGRLSRPFLLRVMSVYLTRGDVGGKENLQGVSRGSLFNEAWVTAAFSSYTLSCRGLPFHALNFGELYHLDLFVCSVTGQVCVVSNWWTS